MNFIKKSLPRLKDSDILSVELLECNISDRGIQMEKGELGKFEELCCGLKEKGKDVFSWDWDGRFSVAVSAFSKDAVDKVMPIVKEHFSNEWDHTRIKQAEEKIKQLASDFGGIRAGQMLFTTENDNGMLMFGAWWPWGNGETISLRVGLLADKKSVDEELEMISQFKKWFTA